MKCPKCDNLHVRTERRPDGNSTCRDCNFTSPTHEFAQHGDIYKVESFTVAETEVDDGSKYRKRIPSELVDVYDILKAFEVTNPAIQHAVKKLLAGGKRGHKDIIQDLEEAKWSIGRAIQLES